MEAAPRPQWLLAGLLELFEIVNRKFEGPIESNGC
jgi:hypothetical protein